MRLLLLALRNLMRNKRRSLVTSLAVAFGAIAIVFLQAVVNGVVRNVVETAALAKVGAVQVFKAGYLGSDEPLKMSLSWNPELVAQIKAVPGVTAVAPRLDFDGMLTNGSEGTMFLATAIDPAVEYEVCPQRATFLAKGSQPLRPGAPRATLIGKTLADSLGAKEGATLVMQAAGVHATANALDVTVSGFLPTNHPLVSKRLATVDLGFAQELLRMKGQVTEYVVGVADLEQVDEVAGRVRAQLGAGYEVTTWKQMDPGMWDRVNFLRYILFFVALVLFLLVATGIVNTMMMSVYERVREIGTMLAVGVRRWQVTLLFLSEAAFLGLASAVTGVGAGYAIVRVLARSGVQQHAPGGDVMTYYPDVSARFLALVVGFAITGAVLAAVYPAWKASRLRPVEALRAT